MSSKVSVSNASSNSATSRSDSGATRAGASAGATQNFSSALNAASVNSPGARSGNTGGQANTSAQAGSGSRGTAAQQSASNNGAAQQTSTSQKPQAAQSQQAGDAGQTQQPQQNQQPQQAQQPTGTGSSAGSAAVDIVDAVAGATDGASADAQLKLGDDGGADLPAAPRTSKTTTADATDAAASAAGAAGALALLMASGAVAGGGAGSGQQPDDAQQGSDARGTDAIGHSDAAGAIAAAANAAAALAGSLALSPLSQVATTAPPVSDSRTDTASVSSTGVGSTQTAQSDQAILMTLNTLAAGDSAGAGTGDGAGAAGGHDQGAAAASSTQTNTSAITNNLPDLIGRLSAAQPQAMVERSISTPVSDRNWSGEVAGQVRWMVNERVQSATLKLSPEHLGPLEVHIDVQSSQVNVSFSAQHPDTRSALEQSMPALRQLMASGGLTLGQTSVQQENRSTPHYTSGSSRAAVSAVHSVDPVPVSSIRLPGLIDEYA